MQDQYCQTLESESRTKLAMLFSPEENQNDLELKFNVFSLLLILVVEALNLMIPTNATLASLSFLKYSRWRPR